MTATMATGDQMCFCGTWVVLHHDRRPCTLGEGTFSHKLTDRDTPPLARASDPATSHDGAEDIRPKRKSQKAVLLDVFRAHGPQTAESACAIAGLERGGWKRVSELLHERKLEWTGRILPNESGSEAQELRVAQPDAGF